MNTQTAIVPGSLSAIAQQEHQSLAESFMSADAIILCDTSGSMGDNDSRGGKTRYEVALEELAQLQAKMPGKLAILSFSNTVVFCPGGVPQFLMATTDLAGALRFARVADVDGMQFIVISDGEPDDTRAALAEAAQYRSKISTIFVGPEDDRTGGRDFLARLAAKSGGQAITADRVRELAAKTERLLLGA